MAWDRADSYGRAARLLAVLPLLGCAAPDVLGPHPAPARLVVENPAGADLRIAAVAGDRCIEVAHPGRVLRAVVDVRPGGFVVDASTPMGRVALPAPLFEPTLGDERTCTVSVPHFPTAPADSEFAWIPSGPAVLGDLLGIGQEDERPARVVDVGSFWLARTEVTNAQYAAFLTAVEPQVDAAWCAFDSRKCRLVRDASGRWSTPAPREPVVTVSLAGARAYCAWRTRTSGVRHRLPSEVEWEKAARGPESFVFAYGNVYHRFAANQESGRLRDVGSFAPNGYGLFDMTGNAFEWTDDAYAASVGGPPQAEFQVLRGGSFVLDGMYLRNAFRMRQRPDVRTDDIGFRVARDDAPQARDTTP
ncbi:MAG: SUMF1/EgtB/PvdO family nonheme iron enzyme [Planctomycetota bacterium]